MYYFQNATNSFISISFDMKILLTPSPWNKLFWCHFNIKVTSPSSLWWGSQLLTPLFKAKRMSLQVTLIWLQQASRNPNTGRIYKPQPDLGVMTLLYSVWSLLTQSPGEFYCKLFLQFMGLPCCASHTEMQHLTRVIQIVGYHACRYFPYMQIQFNSHTCRRLNLFAVDLKMKKIACVQVLSTKYLGWRRWPARPSFSRLVVPSKSSTPDSVSMFLPASQPEHLILELASTQLRAYHCNWALSFL